MMEVDFTKGLPANATLHTARMYMEETTAAGESRMLDEFAMPGGPRPRDRPAGPSWSSAARAPAHSGATTTTPSSATASRRRRGPRRSARSSPSGRLCGASGARRIGVITPYVDELNAKIKASIEDDGVTVVSIAGLGITENFEIARVTHDEIVSFALSSLGHLEIDLVFASCTNFGAVEARTVHLREARACPSSRSNHAVLAATIEQLGLSSQA